MLYGSVQAPADEELEDDHYNCRQAQSATNVGMEPGAAQKADVRKPSIEGMMQKYK